MLNLGYCCINLTLTNRGVKTSRGMIQRTFKQRGLSYASELAYDNVKDLHKIIKWNIDNNISLYRITSDLFPWNSEYKLEQLPHIDSIVSKLQDIGQLILLSNMRVSFHPSHFVKLGSDKERVVTNSIHDINHHAEIFDIMGLPKSYEYPINIHIGSGSKDMANTIVRFRNNIELLTDSARARLVVENDDKPSLYSVKRLISALPNTPITFDYFHHSIHPDDVTEEDAFLSAYETWRNTTPLFHYSDSKKVYEDKNTTNTAHADYIYNPISSYGKRIDVDLEAKSKELALFKYRSEYMEAV